MPGPTAPLGARGASWWCAGSTGEASRRETARGRTAGATAASIGVGLAARLVERRSGADLLAQGCVDAKCQPRQKTVLDRVAQQDVRHEGVAGLGLLGQDAVLGVGGERLRVGGVDGGGLDFGDQVLVEEHLADVRGGRVDERVVREGRRVQVHHDVDVRRAARVVAREQCVELRNAVGVGGLHAAEEGCVQVGRVAGRVAVAAGGDAGVDSGGVAVCEVSVVCRRFRGNGQLTPHLEVSTRDRLAGLDIQDLDIDGHCNAGLRLNHILTDILSSDVYMILSGAVHVLILTSDLQYGPSVTSGLRTQDPLLAKMVVSGVSVV